MLQFILTNLWSVLLIAVFFGGSIFVHELGHFLAARRRGVIVERFSIGFGPKIFSWKGKDGVEYRLSWLPLGGYVALPQLADMRGIEGDSRTDLHRVPPPSYATKMIVFGAGAFFNILFAVTPAARDRWLVLMHNAFTVAQLPEEAEAILRPFFLQVANHMLNRPE